MSVRIHPALNFYLAATCMMSKSTTNDVPTYRRNVFQSTVIFDLGGFDKILTHINKLAYCIHAISFSNA